MFYEVLQCMCDKELVNAYQCLACQDVSGPGTNSMLYIKIVSIFSFYLCVTEVVGSFAFD